MSVKKVEKKTTCWDTSDRHGFIQKIRDSGWKLTALLVIQNVLNVFKTNHKS